MYKNIIVMFLVVLAGAAEAAWWWPFGGKKLVKARMSELLEPASSLMDSAADYASDGNVSEAVEEYKRALHELDRIELENPDRADSAEFATVRNKRAIANAAIDSLLLKQARDNARRVAISDTRDLEVRYALRKGLPVPEWALTNATAKAAGSDVRFSVATNDASAVTAGSVKSVADAAAELESELDQASEPNQAPAASDATESQAQEADSGSARSEQLKKAIQQVADKDFEAARQTIDKLLAVNASDVAALNIRAVIEIESGDYKAAETTLRKAIYANPSAYHSYYNMARLLLRSRPETSRDAAAKYYDTGRSVGGPVDEKLEEKLK